MAEWIGSKRIPVRGKNAPAEGFAIVDEADYHLLSQYRWHGDKDGYPSRTVNVTTINGKRIGRQVRMHQDVIGIRQDKVIDHKNRKINDNRRSNLRHLSIQQNSFNRGAKGISWSDTRKRWCAHITVSGKAFNLGRYKRKEDAMTARREAEVKYFEAALCSL